MKLEEQEQPEAAPKQGPDFSKVPGARVVHLIGGEAHAWTVPEPSHEQQTREYSPYE